VFDDDWLCLCGNRPREDGFFPVHGGGKIVDPALEEWTANEFICDRCGRMIVADTLLAPRQLNLRETYPGGSTENAP
jgi:hypothetical protein